MSLSFKGGIHPLRESHEGKGDSRAKPIRAFAPATVCIPVDMHIGAPSEPCVMKGEKVKLGQVIATPVGGIGIPVHASVSGEVVSVSPRQMLGKTPSICIEIANDHQDEWTSLSPLGDVETAPADQIIQAVRNAGICGLGGACFPTHAKMRLPEGKSVDTILLNGSECETFLTSDHRLMLEEPVRIVDGLRAIMRDHGDHHLAAVANRFAVLDQAFDGHAGIAHGRRDRGQHARAVVDHEAHVGPAPAMPAGRRGRWLEVGVGTGRFAVALGIRIGLDPSAAMLAYAARRGVRTLVGTAERLPFATARLDGVLLAFALCFVKDAEKALRECARVLQPGGTLLLGIVPADGTWGIHYARKAAAGHSLYSQARFRTVSETVALVQDQGFELCGSGGALFQPPGCRPTGVPRVVPGIVPGAGFAALRFRRAGTAPALPG